MVKIKYLCVFTILIFCFSACSQSKPKEQSEKSTGVTESENTKQSDDIINTTDMEADNKILEIQAKARKLADNEKEMVEHDDIDRSKTLWDEAIGFVRDCPDYFENDESIENAILYGYYIEYINEDYSGEGEQSGLSSRYYMWRIGKDLSEVASKVYTNEIEDSEIEHYLTEIDENVINIYGEN